MQIKYSNQELNKWVYEDSGIKELTQIELPNKLSKNRENDNLLINLVKSIVIPLLPRELDSELREKLILLLKEIHELNFSLVDESGNVVYEGRQSDNKVTTESEVILEEPQKLSLVSLINKKSRLIKELELIDSELKTQVDKVTNVLEDKISKLNSIKEYWINLNQSIEAIETLSTIASAVEQLENINLPTLD